MAAAGVKKPVHIYHANVARSHGKSNSSIHRLVLIAERNALPPGAKQAEWNSTECTSNHPS